VEDGKARKVLKSKKTAVSAIMEELISDVMEQVQCTSFQEN
jgi:hypothetical protein